MRGRRIHGSIKSSELTENRACCVVDHAHRSAELDFKHSKEIYSLYREHLDTIPIKFLPRTIELTLVHQSQLFLVLLKKHPKAKEKIGCGVQEIFMRREFTDVYDKRGNHQGVLEICSFFLRRIDGTETDFSYLKCFNRGKRDGSHYNLDANRFEL